MKLLVRHQTSYSYGAGSSRVAMLLKLMPRDYEGLRVLEWQVSINDEAILGFTPNGFGDLEALWIRHDRLETVNVVAEGLVETSDHAGIVRGLVERCHPQIYLRRTPLTEASPEIRDLAEAAQGSDLLDRMHRLSDLVRDAVAYRAGATGPDTSAAEALTIGSGVCQDHAQIFIAAARSVGVPARYVVGYLATQDGEALHETHAWSEVLVPGVGWIGFDTSNRVCTTDAYVRLAAGLDAHDAAPVRGSAMAAGTIQIDADVRIAQASDDEREQQLQRQQQQQRRAR
ncbi:MAG: transglutaminase family protein [Sphingobium sp.]|nr:MAG: transglutaminase family protein [Sphingobium sp.]